jgi:hypothetical protein
MAEFKISRLKYTWKGDWSSGNVYVKDDVISYGAKVYVCLVGHTAESGGSFYNDLTAVIDGTVPPQPNPRWELMLDGSAWTGVWTVNTPYALNDIVKYGGTVFICISPHTSAATTGEGLEANQLDWTSFARTEDWRTDWTVSTRYKTNDVVRYGGSVYRCVDAHISALTVAEGLEASIEYWDIIIQAEEYRGEWAPNTRYRFQDIVKYGGQMWGCAVYHTSTDDFDEIRFVPYLPGLVYEGVWSSSTLYQAGDIVKYGGYSYTAKRVTINDIPSVSSSDWDLLTRAYNFLGEWTALTNYLVGDVVTRSGQLYSCIQNSTAIDVTNALYWELTIPGSFWKNLWLATTNYVIGDLVMLDSKIYRCIQSNTASSANRPDNFQGSTYWKLTIEGDLNNRLRYQGDVKTYGVTEDGSSFGLTRRAIGTDSQVLKSVDNEIAWETFTDSPKVYYVSIDGINDPAYGTTLEAPWRTIRYACQNITGPATIFIKTGYYQEVLPISIPADVALVGDELRSVTISPASGFETSNMFYVRNGSGIRNLTLTGLSGVLGAPNIYLTRRPTAGAYVSLDPGTGPADTSVHITTRSPYIQNVTTFGTGCVGLKVDGSLHNSGNRSIVANDFTQILSDGIGAWVTSRGLSELVSVFSYYGHIGYLSEDGGKIRATNGNSSYGTYGTVAEGFDQTETPITATVNNRSQEARVATALSGQAGDQILILEYAHCGQGYSSAAFTFAGAGTGASVTPVFRNGAVSQVRIKSSGDSTPAGGGSYLIVSNNAQGGDNTSITIASNDVNTAANYVGMRVVITSGTGTGQYGYIQSYNEGTKVATIYKESDSTAGWEHVAGFSIEAALDTSTVYSIEPRVTFSAPPSGTRALGRVVVESGRITLVKIWNCGSGYASAPTVTLNDPNRTSDAVLEARINDGVLGPVTWNNRGSGYQTSSTIVTLTGNGFADEYQVGTTLVLSNVSNAPGPGDNLSIANINDITFKIVTVQINNGTAPNLDVTVTISPNITVEESPDHAEGVIIRQRYSQVRLTGHDFLDIGTGNFVSTDYPALYGTYEFIPAPENEVAEFNGGRVFYTSTDQDGNFRVGELFKVEQATGTVTISASLFQLSGLEEISVGGVTVGGTGTVVREFSTDATFTADSNNIIPTQRAIKAYLTSRISGGGSDAFTTILTAGTVRVGPNLIGTTSGNQVNMLPKVNLKAGVDGDLAALNFFFDSFRD